MDLYLLLFNSVCTDLHLFIALLLSLCDSNCSCLLSRARLLHSLLFEWCESYVTRGWILNKCLQRCKSMRRMRMRLPVHCRMLHAESESKCHQCIVLLVVIVRACARQRTCAILGIVCSKLDLTPALSKFRTNNGNEQLNIPPNF